MPTLVVTDQSVTQNVLRFGHGMVHDRHEVGIFNNLRVRQTGRGISSYYFNSIMVFDSVNVAPVTPTAESR